MFDRITISCRVAILSASLMLTLLILGVLSVRALSAADARSSSQYKERTVPLVELGAMLSDVQHARGLLSSGLGGESSTVSESYYVQVQPVFERAQQRWEAYKANRVDTAYEQIDQAWATYSRASDSVLSLAREGNFEGATEQMRGESAQHFEALRELVINAMNDKRSAAQAANTQAEADSASARKLVLAVLVTGLLAGVGLAVVIVRGVRRMLTEAIDIARTVAAGDLSLTIEADASTESGRLKMALRDMQGSLVSLVARVQMNAQGVETATSEIANGSFDLSQRTERQAAMLQETAASMTQLGTTCRHTADGARMAEGLAGEASALAVKGGEVMGQVVQTMDGISGSSRKIGEIISVIDGIAFQTNILALNAAVEAARAGEQGRGFAVVASEVRGLAQRSADAAKQIKQLIGDSSERIEHGAALVERAGGTMNEVVASIQRVASIISEISGATVEQSAGVARLEQTVVEMDQNTQQNAALVEQTAAVSDSLKGQAASLVEMVSAFRLAGRA